MNMIFYNIMIIRAKTFVWGVFGAPQLIALYLAILETPYGGCHFENWENVFGKQTLHK